MQNCTQSPFKSCKICGGQERLWNVLRIFDNWWGITLSDINGKVFAPVTQARLQAIADGILRCATGEPNPMGELPLLQDWGRYPGEANPVTSARVTWQQRTVAINRYDPTQVNHGTGFVRRFLCDVNGSRMVLGLSHQVRTRVPAQAAEC